MKFLFGFIGALVGAILFGSVRDALIFPGMVVGLLLGVLGSAQTELSRRLRKIEERSVRAPPPGATDTTGISGAPIPAPPEPEPPAVEAPAAPGSATRSPWGPQAEAVEPPAWSPPAGPAAPLPLVQWVKAFFTGGNAIVRVGVIVLFFGVAFLFKYAVDRQMLPIELRLLAAAAGAMTLLVFGWRLRGKREAYALALQGGGVGLLYLTVFAALRLYSVLPAALAFGLLVAIAVFSAMLAVLQNAKSLAVVGAAGGFLAPILTSTGGGDHVLLFGYYALLNAGILGIGWFKAWRELNLMGFVFTFVIGALWGKRYYHAELFATTEPFLILFFVFYAAIALLYAWRQPLRLKGYVDGTLVFGVPIVGFVLQALLVRPYEYGLAWSAFGAGLFYMALATVLLRRQPAHGRLLTESFLALGVVFGTLAIPLALDARWTAAAWALEGAAIVWVSGRQARWLGRAFGTLLIFGAGLSFARGYGTPVDAWPVLNGMYLGCVLIAVAALFGSHELRRARADRREWEAGLSLALLAWGVLWWVGGGLHEVVQHAVRRDQPAWAIAFIALSGVVADKLGARLNWNALRAAALGLLPAGFVLGLASFFTLTHAFEGFGALAWLLFFGAHYRVLRRREDLAHRGYVKFLHGASLWLIAPLVAWELEWAAREYIQGAPTWALSAHGLVLAVVILAVAAACRGARWPWAGQRAAYLGLGALPLIGLAGLWSLAVNLGSTGEARPLDYLPLLNPLDISQAAVLLAAVAWFQAYHAWRGAHFAYEWRRLFLTLTGAAAFLWLNAMLLRTLHHWAGIAFDLGAMYHSMLVQAALSIFWTVLALALMIAATRRSWRVSWTIGAALLGLVVVKLFIVDLARTGTIARIVSFIVVGVLLLLIGYFSPVPPRDKKVEVAS